MTDEPLLQEETRRFTFFPIKYPRLIELYKIQLAAFWKPEEIDFSADTKDFDVLNKDEQLFIKRVLAFFASSDGLVNFNLSSRFLQEIKAMEALVAYTYQMMMENIHCVHGNTRILTDMGYLKIKHLVDESVNVWNGKEFSSVVVKYTGNKPMFRVKLVNGLFLDCTPEHKWVIRSVDPDKPGQYGEVEVMTKDLKVGYVVSNYELPRLDLKDPVKFNKPYIRGYLSLYSQHADEVPLNFSTSTKLSWLRGLVDSDSGSCNLKHDSIVIGSYEKDYIEEIQLMLSTLGIIANIIPDKDENRDNKDCYSLFIHGSNFNKLLDLGFKSATVDLEYIDMETNTDYTYNQLNALNMFAINSIEQISENEPSYCFNEPKLHRGVFNGILTSQSESYSIMLDNLVKDPEERDTLFNSISEVESVKLISDWAMKWIESDLSFAHRVVAFAVIEGVMFSGAFASIFWIKKYKSNGGLILNGLIRSNEFIARDEGMHVQFACELYSLLKNKLSYDEVCEIVHEGVVVSKMFFTDALPIRLIGINKDSMNDYIEYISDRLLINLGYKKKYNTANPFEFMETIGMLGKTNFFESRPTEYQSAHVLAEKTDDKFAILDDF